jgi:putative hydrolase of the HAD superfamily
MPALKTILFDLGNVIVHFSHDRMCDQIGEVLGRTGPQVRTLLIESGLMWDFERGKISEIDLLAALEKESGLKLDRATVAKATSDIFSLNEAIVPIIKSLKEQGLRLVLLSNTSSWHVEWVKQNWNVLDLFDQLVLSYEVGAIKPEPPAFEAALNAIQCQPAECFYTDDIAAYVAKGRDFGLQAEIFTDTDALRRHLRERGIEV